MTCQHCSKEIHHRLIVQRRKFCSMRCQRDARNAARRKNGFDISAGEIERRFLDAKERIRRERLAAQ